MLSFTLYASLATFGTDLFSGYVDRTFALATRFAELLAAGGCEVATPPEANIVCFRFVPDGTRDPDDLQQRIRRHVIARGGFYLVQTRLNGAVYLRTALMNPLTSEADLAALIDEVKAAARALTNAS
jgi:L-2,4-diaminobutyrate decarboxylase